MSKIKVIKAGIKPKDKELSEEMRRVGLSMLRLILRDYPCDFKKLVAEIDKFDEHIKPLDNSPETT